MARPRPILFTVMPRGSRPSTRTTLPVSVFVSPRLFGAREARRLSRLGRVDARSEDSGLSLEFRCGGKYHRARHRHAVRCGPTCGTRCSTPRRSCARTSSTTTPTAGPRFLGARQLSVLKSIYQEAGVGLALPDSGDGLPRAAEQPTRPQRPAATASTIHWDDANEATTRRRRAIVGRPVPVAAQQARGLDLDARGTDHRRPAQTRVSMTSPCRSLSSTTCRRRRGTKLAPDCDTHILDFHQALSSLNAYPALQRALGLVFDLELPQRLRPRSQGRA